MFPEDSSGSPANSADGVDFREVLYGSARPEAPSGAGRTQAYSEGGPLPLAGEEPRGPHRASPWADESPAQGGWGSTSYGEWLLASSSASPDKPLLLERVQRVGAVQRLRDAASYRGPSGISQPRQPVEGVLYSPSIHANDNQRGNAYMGAVGGGPYVGARGGGAPQCMQPSPSVYGLGNHQREASQRQLIDFASPQDLREPSADVYVLAADSDTEITNERDGLPLFADGGGPRSLRRRSSFTSAGGFEWGGGPAGEGGGGPLEEAPPFERLSPLDVSKGPLKKRQPTDVWCLSLFGFCWILLLWLVGSSLHGASPQRLTAGIDWLGRVCGVDAGVQHLPYLYWPSKNQPSGPVDFELDSCSLLPVRMQVSRPKNIFLAHRLSSYSLEFFFFSFLRFVERKEKEIWFWGVADGLVG
ncbi:hypothetical protein Emag_001385 [Eimeria magna]